jgi:hypothetical protein
MKKTTKKWTALLLSLVMVFTLAGCNKKADDTPVDATPTKSAVEDTTEDPTQAPTPTTEPEEITYDFGGVTVKCVGGAWGNLTNEDPVFVEAKAFVEEKYNIKLELATLEGYDGYNDDDILIASIAAGDPAAHIMNLNPESMISCYLNDVLYDLTDDLDVLQVGSAYSNAGSWKGRTYGIAYENIGDAWVLVYDRAYLKEIGMEKTPTDMFMEGKWDYESCKAYLSELQSKLPDEKYAIGCYPYHWGVMAAGANGTHIVDQNGKVGISGDEALIEATQFYSDLEAAGIAFPAWLTRGDDGTVTANDIAYAVDDERIVLKRAEIWQLSGIPFDYGITYWPWGSNVTCTGDYTTLSDNYYVSGAYWGIDAIVKAAIDITGIPGNVLALINQDYQYAISDDGKEWMHAAYVAEQNGETLKAGAEFGEPRSFTTEQDIVLFDWAHGRYYPDLSWTFASAEILNCWRVFQDIFMEDKDIRATFESYFNEAKPKLEELGIDQ